MEEDIRSSKEKKSASRQLFTNSV